MTEKTIDWSRLAEPQADHYDTGVFLDELGKQFGYHRTLVPEIRRIWEHVELGVIGGFHEDDRYAFAPGHPNVQRVDELLGLWPTMEVQFGNLARVVCPFVERQALQDRRIGSISGSAGPGEIQASASNRGGFADALVHELAHAKLRLLGVQLLDGGDVVTNDPGQLYPSPIRTDRLRPMTAVLHAQYSFVHVLEMNLAMAQEAEDDYLRQAILVHVLPAKTARLEFGHAVIMEHIETDERGEGFMQGFSAWSARLFGRSRQWLDSHQIELPRFEHPLVARFESG